MASAVEMVEMFFMSSVQGRRMYDSEVYSSELGKM